MSLPDTLLTSSLILPTSRVLVALSGGPDSCALLLALCALADAGRLPRPVGAAHFHHGLRGADADADAAFSAALCARLGVPCVIGLGAAQPERGESPNAAARRARYDFLAEAARDFAADAIATAHTRDDQAETVLGRILRGTSVDGLAGIPARRDLGNGLTVIRPLLAVRRAEIEAYCDAHGITPRRDPSNEKPRYTRSRIRRRLPELAAEFNPQLTDALVRLSEQAARDSELLDGLADSLYQKAVRTSANDEDILLIVSRLREAVPALRGRVLLRVLRETSPNGLAAERVATMEFVKRLEALLNSPKKLDSVNLPGNFRAWCDGSWLRVGRADPPSRSGADFTTAMIVPGETIIAEIGLRLTAARLSSDEESLPTCWEHSWTMDMAYNFLDPPPLLIRPARMQEKLVLSDRLSGKWKRRVKEILEAGAVQTHRQARWPLVARADTSEPLWVIGYNQAESTWVTEEDAGQRNVLRLTAVFEQI